MLAERTQAICGNVNFESINTYRIIRKNKMEIYFEELP